MNDKLVKTLICLDPDSYEKLKKIKEISGKSHSSIIRSLIQNKKIVPKPGLEPRLIYEINKIGVNINQIAKNSNAGFLNLEKLEEEISYLNEILSKIVKFYEP